MRLIVSLLLTLVLAACASAPPGSGTSTAQSSTSSASALSSSSKQQVSSDQTIDVDKDSLDNLSYGDHQDNDLWSRIRRGFAIPDLDSPLVQERTAWYAARPEYVERMVNRSSRYLFHIVEELEKRHMPTELALLPFVESAYNPQALSTAKAAGMWQFIPSTGKTYNLKQNMFSDERRDVVASTDAALDYLSNLHDMFGDWYLALAAYNWGEGNVQRAIARNQAQGLPTDYQSLRLPTETREYVPKLQAIKNIIEHPALYDVKLPEIPNHPYFVSVTTSHDIDVALAARLADLPLSEFRALNPAFKKPVILGATKSKILLPFDNADIFAKQLKSYKKPLSSWTTYTIRRAESPEVIAKRLGVEASTIRSVNGIPPRFRMKAGSTILVPRTGENDRDISSTVADNAVLALEPEVPPVRRVAVRVRRGDSLSAVARRYGVSELEIKRWNRMRGNGLRAGQTLVLMVRGAPERRVAGAVTERRTVSSHRPVTKREAARRNTVKHEVVRREVAKRATVRHESKRKEVASRKGSRHGAPAVSAREKDRKATAKRAVADRSKRRFEKTLRTAER
ncbi:hypothetical protein PATSB16_28420 [Pandoraea thiooxydans]|uniref:Lytic transglycosylase n=1 Tax=Pandoraea thiooxydans TaxID=445709 RepID=A0A0G3ETQ2_9BURK|nr:transglycosylase SLT domain-containing protein [Pandoraea thiooxydans]AKJ68737.1 lytic transglycosylase [Pandoraea thiooxydans]APR96182.1 hypothetical protein PATSB16_28420 [Pandoraea thiooxydans]